MWGRGRLKAILGMDISDQSNKGVMLDEILVMKESQHPNIVDILDMYLVKDTARTFWVVCRLVPSYLSLDMQRVMSPTQSIHHPPRTTRRKSTRTTYLW